MEFDTYNVTVQYTENIVIDIFKIGAASFSQPLLMPLNYSYRG